ncbi:MAG: LysM peptidoglycan-binding domain-containing protein [Lachnospiraceae bacterium]|nr:LysM peptidoglycan-binding domain-containing protein [Lachnospiraceae bacterium]
MRERIKRFLKQRRNIVILSSMIIIAFVFFFGAIVSANTKKEENHLYKYYTSVQIRPGDTLWDIASEYCHDSSQVNAYVKELKEINHLRNNEIYAGKYLTVIYYSDEYK